MVVHKDIPMPVMHRISAFGLLITGSCLWIEMGIAGCGRVLSGGRVTAGMDTGAAIRSVAMLVGFCGFSTACGK